ncbi:squalene/phytoene synthase family protein [Lichenihabitans sp. Uapishka_5]|uniref:phytoene/squalene synthase family protein n=1 Tax=Lichenihabitans sp. Uapishka_5 TaxID=3037302 RepID=UPI0029E7E97D|nr:squalene/phytoene synthase family protein [Lichenihabitans sp. Uapishka_5]MDX7953263.1 squalene/phytoene synthase family protein [Lichenihabitans sp. Uapishka_5]
MAETDPDANHGHCEAILKAADRPAWLATLFAPADKRPILHALGAFAVEIAAVRGKVREPLAGELRLQWWTDAIEGEARGDVRGHPVAAALIDAVRAAHLPRAALTGMVEARRTDLYDDPLGTLDDYAARADALEGAQIALAAQALSGRRDPDVEAAARHAGRVVAVGDTLRALSSPATPLHMTVPLELLRAEGIGAAEVLVRRPTPPVQAALARLIAYGQAELASLRSLRGSLDPDAAPAFLAANLATPKLKRALRRGSDPFATDLAPPLWRQQWTLWRASRRNGVV